jgi:hypothetical protein
MLETVRPANIMWRRRANTRPFGVPVMAVDSGRVSSGQSNGGPDLRKRRFGAPAQDRRCLPGSLAGRNRRIR